MQKPIVAVTVLGVCALAMAVWFSSSRAAQDEPPCQLCVVWSSGDPGVAKNVCFMYTLNAKKRRWIDVVHLVVWGPSAKLLAENEELQADILMAGERGWIVSVTHIESGAFCTLAYGAHVPMGWMPGELICP